METAQDIISRLAKQPNYSNVYDRLIYCCEKEHKRMELLSLLLEFQKLNNMSLNTFINFMRNYDGYNEIFRNTAYHNIINACKHETELYEIIEFCISKVY